MRSFQTERYYAGNTTRVIRAEDLRAEYDFEVESALLAVQNGEDRSAAVHAARADVLKELIDTLEKGVTAPAPDAGPSDIP